LPDCSEQAAENPHPVSIQNKFFIVPIPAGEFSLENHKNSREDKREPGLTIQGDKA